MPRSSAASSRGCHGAATRPHPAAEHTHHWHEVQASSTSARTAAGPPSGRTTCSAHMVTSSGTRRIGAGARSLLAQPAAGKLPRPQGAPPEPPHSAATRLGGPRGSQPRPCQCARNAFVRVKTAAGSLGTSGEQEKGIKEPAAQGQGQNKSA